MSFLIFDIETIPDLSLWTPPAPEAPPPDAPLPGQAGLPGVAAPPPALASVPPTGNINTGPAPGFSLVIPPAGQRKARKPRAKKPKANGETAKEPFAPLYAHRVIAIGWVWMELDAGQAALKGMGCVGTSTFKDDEAALLTGWNDFVRKEQPTVVSWNGRRFDVPVLGLRALRHGISQSWADDGYRKRYSDHHVDLFDVMSEYGAIWTAAQMKLTTFSEIIGLPGKTDVEGPKINGMYQRGEIAKIEAYCCSDAVRTAFLLLRYRLMRGWMSVEQYRVGARALLEAAAGANLGNLTLGVDTNRLLLA